MQKRLLTKLFLTAALLWPLLAGAQTNATYLNGTNMPVRNPGTNDYVLFYHASGGYFFWNRSGAFDFLSQFTNTSAFASLNNSIAGSTVSLSNTVAAHTATLAGVVTNYQAAVLGMIGDGVRLTDVLMTNGAAGIGSASAAFAAGDVGKGCVLYTSTTNHTWIRTTIASVQGPHNATLTAASTVTLTNVLVYGTDNTTLFSNAVQTVYAKGGGKIHFNSGMFCFWKDPGATGDILSSCATIWFPHDYIRDPTTGGNKHVSVEFEGSTWAASMGLSATSNRPSMTGTIFYYAGAKVTGGNYQEVFGFNNATAFGADFPENMYVWQNITFRQPVNPRVWWFNACYGGTMIFKQVAFDVEFPPGFQPDANHVLFQPTNTVTDYYSAGTIWFPGVNNDGKLLFQNSEVYGYGCGVRAGEHQKIDAVNMNWCGTAVSLQGGNYPVNVLNSHFIGCSYDFVKGDIGYASGNVTLNSSGSYTEDVTNNINTIYDPYNEIHGKFDELATGSSYYSGAQGLDVYHSSATSPNSFVRYGTNTSVTVQRSLSSELGGNSMNAGLVFDEPFLEGPGGFYSYSRAPYTPHGFQPWLGAVSAPNNYVPGLSGWALTNSYVSFNDATTNFMTGQTNITVQINFAAPGCSSAAPIYFGTASWSWGMYFPDYRFQGRLTTVSGANIQPTFAASSWNDGNWHQAVMTYDGANIRLYWDTVLIGSAAQTGAITNFGNANLIINSGPATQFLAGHTRVWNRTLSQPDILKCYQNDFSKNIGDASACTNYNVTNLAGTFTSANLNCTNGSFWVATPHGLGRQPTKMYWVLVCINSEAGYPVGTEIRVNGVFFQGVGANVITYGSDSTNVWLSSYSNLSWMYGAYGSNSGTQVALANGGANTPLTNWKLKCYAQ